MIYVTGDTHAAFDRFTEENFPEQKEMTRNDFVIVLGDFGLWHDDEDERERFKFLSERPFTLLFIDGNHSNFDRLYSNEFPIVEIHDGKAHKIRENIYHLIRGHVFKLEGKKFFAFGGAKSHDIANGVLDAKDFPTKEAFLQEVQAWCLAGMQFRMNHISWWEQELPSEEEMELGRQTLKHHKYKVDYVITHCLPQNVAAVLSHGRYKTDCITSYFDDLVCNEDLKFKHWYCGHYHMNKDLLGKYHVRYEKIERIL